MKTILLRPFVDSSLGNSPPLSLMYISSYLKSKNLKVKLIDNCIDRKRITNFSLNDIWIKKIINEIKAYSPDIIGITLFSNELKDIAALSKLLKKEIPYVNIVLGGPHPTTMPQETLEQIPHCDIVIRGEGELVMYNLIKTLSSDKDLKKVKGISFKRKNDKIHHCNDAEIINNLDEFPFPDRNSLIHNYKKRNYGSILYGFPSDTLITSRGCPFQCNFCFKVCNKYRSRSPENVLKEIDWIMKNISPRSIQIMDDSFTIERERCMKILDLLIERNYPCRFKIRSRVTGIDEELLKKMKKAKVETIVYGFESGSQKMLDSFNKKTTVEQNIRACKLTKKAGINCFGDMILFYPGEDKDTLKETEQFIKKAKPTGVKFYVLTPLPKTKIYNDYKDSDLLIGGWNITDKTPWIKLSCFGDLNKMQKLAKKMYIKTFLNKDSILFILKTIGRSFLRSPCLTFRLVSYNLFKKMKY